MGVLMIGIAVGFTFYWRRTTEEGAFWGIALGYASGLAWYLFVPPGVDPSYATTLVPLVVIALVSLLTAERREGREEFYARASVPQHLAS